MKRDVFPKSCYESLTTERFEFPWEIEILDLKISRSDALSLYNRERYGEIGNELTE